MLKLEYSTQFKRDFKKIAKLPIPDLVLIYKIESSTLKLARIGNHSELFR